MVRKGLPDFLSIFSKVPGKGDQVGPGRPQQLSYGARSASRSGLIEVAYRKELASRPQTWYDYRVAEEAATTNARSTDLGPDAFEAKLNQAAAESPMLASIRLDTPNRTLDEPERLALAAVFVHQAMSRSSLYSIDWSSDRARRIYVLRFHWLRSLVLRLALLGLCLVCLGEPPKTTGWPLPPARPVWISCCVAEVTCTTLFVADLVSEFLSCPAGSFNPRRGLTRSRAMYALLVLAT